jgi:6-pyruvoyl-tetrahydropterin synthase
MKKLLSVLALSALGVVFAEEQTKEQIMRECIQKFDEASMVEIKAEMQNTNEMKQIREMKQVRLQKCLSELPDATKVRVEEAIKEIEQQRAQKRKMEFKK